MSNTASNIAAKARAAFISNNRDILAALHQGPDEVMKIVMAAAELDRSAREEVLFFLEGLDQADPVARKMARDSFFDTIFQITAQFFCQALSDGVLTVAMEPTPEGHAQLLELSYVIGNATRPAPPPAPKSAVETLDDQIRWDWANLPSEKVRAKQNDPKYKKRLNELLDSDAIGFKSQATTLHDGANL